jgi:predicted DCC family thiol-disulfide oxidoreductase YuxK
LIYPTDKKIILFDGVCNLCNATVQFILRRDKKKQFLFGSLQGNAGQELLKKFQLPTDQFHSFILIEGEKVYSHSAAVLRVMKWLGGGWSLFYGFVIIPRFIRDPVYNLLSRNRYRLFGKRESCWMPDAGLKERFLD